MQDLEGEKPADENQPRVSEVSLEAEGTEWMSAIEEKPEPVAAEPPKIDTGSLPSWLRGLEKEEDKGSTFAAQEDLPLGIPFACSPSYRPGQGRAIPFHRRGTSP